VPRWAALPRTFNSKGFVMDQTSPDNSSKVSITSGQDTNIGGDAVGRDKITHIYYAPGQPTSGSDELTAERRKAYQSLWTMLEDLHIKLRTDSIGKREFHEHLTAVNAFILKNSLHLDKAHGQLASDYIKGVFGLSELIARSKDKRAKRHWAATHALPEDTLAEYEEIKAAWSSVDTLRDRLTTEFRAILQL